MRTIEQYDTQIGISVYPTEFVNLTKSEIKRLSRELNFPELLICKNNNPATKKWLCQRITHRSANLEGENLVAFIDWVTASPSWRNKFERDLKCVHMHNNGALVLSTSIPLYEFNKMMDEGGDLPFVQALKEVAKLWEEDGVHDIFFNGIECRKLQENTPPEESGFDGGWN